MQDTRYFTELYNSLGKNKKAFDTLISTAILAPRANITERIWRETLHLALTLDDDEVDRIVEIASSLLVFEAVGVTERIVKIPHKSMIDWITGPVSDQSSARGMGFSELFVSVQQRHHVFIAKACE